MLGLGLLSGRAQTTVTFDDDNTIAITTSTALGGPYDGEGATSVVFSSLAAITSTSLGSDGEDDNLITSIVLPFAEGTTTAVAIGTIVTSCFDGTLASTFGKRENDSEDRQRI